MRESLTGLAIVLILLLTAALAAPYFVDWNGQRAFVEARLSQALGEKVTIGGNIDLKLLPTPYLVLDQAVIGDDDGAITLGIRHLNLEMAVTPLLHGAFEVVEARLEEPTIRITLSRDRTVPMLPDAPAFKADVRFDRIAIVDGTLAIADPLSGRTLSADHLDFEIEAASLAGPFKGGGSAGERTARTKFRFATTPARFGRTRTKFVLDETRDHAGLDLDGIFALSDAGGTQRRQTFDGMAVLSGHLRDESTILFPWRLSGPVHVDPLRAALGAGELRLGGEDHAIPLAATGEADLGPAPTLRMTLAGKQIDIDRLFGGGIGRDGVALKPNLPDIGTVRRSLAGSTPFLPTTIALSIEAATYASDTLANVESTFALGTREPSLIRLKGDGPGRSHLDVQGLLNVQGLAPTQSSFEGSVAFAAGDMAGFAAWLGNAAPGLADVTGVPFKSIEAKAAVTADAGVLAAKTIKLRLDRSSLTGSAAFRPTEPTRPASLKADLEADALDLDALPDLGSIRAFSLNLDLRLDAHGIKVAEIGGAPLNAGHINVAFVKTGTHMALDPLRIEGLGGATINATAMLDPEGGRIDARIDAERLIDAAALARRLYPGAISDGFASRAPSMAPARLTVGATFKPRDGQTPEPTRLNVAGMLGGTRIDASLVPDPARVGVAGLANVTDAIVAKADVSAPDGGTLLSQIGLPTLPLHNLGPSRFALDARGRANGPLATTVHAAFGATALDFAGTMRVAADTTEGSGALTMASPDVSPLLQSLALAFPDLLGRIPLDATGVVTVTPTGVSLADLKGHVAGSSLAGALVWRGGVKSGPTIAGSLALDRLSLETLLGLSLGPQQPHRADARWSNIAFGTGLIDPPRTRVDLSARTFDIAPGLTGRDAKLALDVSRGLVALKRLSTRLDTGEATADITVRRDGPNAAVEGTVSVTDMALDLPSAKGRLSGRLDLAGSGGSALSLVGSLAGTGGATIDALLIPQADPAALPKVFEAIEADRITVDEDSILRALGEAAKKPLSAGSRDFTLSLAAGVLHAEPKPSDMGSRDGGASVTSGVGAAFDLRTLTIDAKIDQTLHALPKDWVGAPPKIVITLAGPLNAPTRTTTDISVFINALATRALARESARIEAYEFDVRERAFFNQRLQADRRREQDRVKAEDDARSAIEAAARKVEAERRAREAAAAKLERQRKAEEAARAAKAQADQEQAARDKAAQDRAAQDRAAQERAARGRVTAPSGTTPEPIQPEPAPR